MAHMTRGAGSWITPFLIDRPAPPLPRVVVRPPHGAPGGGKMRLGYRLGAILARSRERERLSRMGFAARQDLGWHRVEAELGKRPWEA